LACRLRMKIKRINTIALGIGAKNCLNTSHE
jgi:hypothetical protein